MSARTDELMTSTCGWAWVVLALEHELAAKDRECLATLTALPQVGAERMEFGSRVLGSARPSRDRIGNAIEKAQTAARHYDEVARVLAWARAERKSVFDAETRAREAASSIPDAKTEGR